MRISTFFYIIRQGIVNLFRNKLYTLASIATISACLFLFGVFYCVVQNIEHIVATAEEGVSVTVFFDESTDDARLQDIGKLIKQRSEVRDLIFTSDDEVWEQFGSAYFGENYAEGFTENPLAGEDNYEIFLTDVSLQDSLITWLNSIPEVRKINYSEVTAHTLSGMNLMIAYVSLGIIIILLAVSMFLIHNTVTIGISVRKVEINIMKYIGATDFFVRAPFVIESLLIGFIGSAIPLVAIYYLYDYVMEYLVQRFAILTSILSFIPKETLAQFLTPVTLGIGVGIGFLGSIVTVKKHLRV